MTKVQITAEMQNLIDILKTPFLIVNEGKVVDVFSSKELARAAKTEDGVVGKIVDGLKCEFEIVDSELPDETISEEDEAELAAALDAEEVIILTKHEPSNVRAKSPTQSATMKTSMKLDRTISCVETGEVWKNANQMWKANPNWMTSAQQDGLTKKLYSAAKNGEKITVEINARHFTLVNV